MRIKTEFNSRDVDLKSLKQERRLYTKMRMMGAVLSI